MTLVFHREFSKALIMNIMRTFSMHHFIKSVISISLVLVFFLYSNSVLSYPDGDKEDLVIDAPWRTVRDYLPVLFFTPEFTENKARQITNIVLYNYDPATKDKNLIFLDNRHPIGNISIDDNFQCDVTFIDPNGVTRAPSTKDEKINDFWHYIARVPTSCIGMGDKKGKPGVHYLRGEFNWGRLPGPGSINPYLPVTEYKVLRVVVSENGLAKFSKVDHHYDVHVHTIAEQTKWHGMTNIDASKKAFGGPLAMLMESAYALGMVETKLKDANWTDFKNKIVTTDHNAFFSGNPYDAGSSPGTTGPTSNTNGKRGEFDWYRDHLGDLGGEEITVQGANGLPIQDLSVDVDLANGSIGIDNELGLGSHFLAYGSPHFEGPWHGGHVAYNKLKEGAPNNISITHAISHMGSTNGFGYAAHPESANFAWSFEYFDRAIGLAPYNIDGVESPIIQKNQNDFVFKGIQIWNKHADKKSFRTGDIEVSESHHFDPFTAATVPDGFPNITSTEQFVFNPKFRNGHDKTYSRYKFLLKRGLSYSFDNSRDYRFIRKLYMSAGTDSHGDFNYELSIGASALVEFAEIFNVDPNIMSANNNAFGRMRTYTLTSQRYVRAGASVPPRCSSFPFCNDETDRVAPSYYPVEDYKEGNTVVTGGPIGRFVLDGNCRFNSDYHQLIWHDSFCKWENHDGMIGGRGKFDGGNTLLAPVGNDDVYLNAQWIGSNDYLADNHSKTGAMKFNFVKINGVASGIESDTGSLVAGKRNSFHLVSVNEALQSPPTLKFPGTSALIMEGELTLPLVEGAQSTEEYQTKFITNPVWIAPYRFNIDAPETCPMKPGELKVEIEFGLSMNSTLPAKDDAENESFQPLIHNHLASASVMTSSSASDLGQQEAPKNDSVFSDPQVYQGIRVRLKPLNSQGNSTDIEYEISDGSSVWSAMEIPAEFSPRLTQDAKLTVTNSKAIPCSTGSWSTSTKEHNAKVASYAIVVDQIYDMFHNYLNPIATVFSVKKPRSIKDRLPLSTAPEVGPILLPNDDINLACSDADSRVCKSNGASCEILIATNNVKNSVCRWSNSNTEKQCLKTKGIWTSSNSKYAKRHLNAVPLGKRGACISERKNLK